MLESLGFAALATTSSGFAFTLGRRDTMATLKEVSTHIEALAAATDLPISADLENPYGAEPWHAAIEAELVVSVPKERRLTVPLHGFPC